MATKDEARNLLRDIGQENCFWVNNGPVLKNLEELSRCLSEMSDDSFSYHANKEKNDFSNWLSEVIGDKKLAADIQSARSRESAAKKVEARLNSLIFSV